MDFLGALLSAAIRAGAGALCGLGLVTARHGLAQSAAPPPLLSPLATTEWAARADSAQAALAKSFWQPEAHYYLKDDTGDAGFNYWWQAHGPDVLADGYQRTQSAPESFAQLSGVMLPGVLAELQARKLL